jgi:hypothetical protein
MRCCIIPIAAHRPTRLRRTGTIPWVTPGLGVSVSAPGATAIGGADFQDNGASAAGQNSVALGGASGANLIGGGGARTTAAAVGGVAITCSRPARRRGR